MACCKRSRKQSYNFANLFSVQVWVCFFVFFISEEDKSLRQWPSAPAHHPGSPQSSRPGSRSGSHMGWMTPAACLENEGFENHFADEQ